MARKSKTQKAKASAARQARKAEHEAELLEIDSSEQNSDGAKKAEDTEASSKSVLKKAASKDSGKDDKKSSKKSEDKPKKKRLQFLSDVKGELKRVTWPTKADVLRWSGVVVAALVFFGVFVAILDNLIITPILVAVSGL
jgi:preprotein translocase subunit SecE